MLYIFPTAYSEIGLIEKKKVSLNSSQDKLMKLKHRLSSLLYPEYI